MAAKISLHTTAGLWFSTSLLVLAIPLYWLGPLILSSLVHELFHLSALYLMGIRSYRVHLKPFGVYLETDPLTPGQETIAAVAGPVGALSLLFFHRVMPKTALCAFLQSVFHLLPIFPLDGGRALRSWTEYMGFASGEVICKTTECIVWLFLFVLGVCFCIRFPSAIMLFGAGALLVARTLREKYLANRAGKGYNIRTKI